jgi:hypothetical protein
LWHLGWKNTPTGFRNSSAFFEHSGLWDFWVPDTRGMDLLIATHAIFLDSVLVTHNLKEFERVPGLKIENWEK